MLGVAADGRLLSFLPCERARVRSIARRQSRRRGEADSSLSRLSGYLLGQRCRLGPSDVRSPFRASAEHPAKLIRQAAAAATAEERCSLLDEVDDQLYRLSELVLDLRAIDQRDGLHRSTETQKQRK